MTKQEILLSTRTNKELIEGWELICLQDKSIEKATVKGWYMDEIEKRFPKEFNTWLESETCEDEELRMYLGL